MKKHLFNWSLVVIWLALIFFLSHRPNLKTELGYDFWLRKAAHIVEYAVLCFLIFRAMLGSQFSTKRALLVSVLFSILYAASDEYHQTFIFGRNGSAKDWGIDSAGAVIGGALLALIHRNKEIN